MRNRSKHTTRSMEIEKNLKEEPHLSGAYIRSLVKQLTSSKNKHGLEDTMNQTKPDSMNGGSDGGNGNGNGFPQNLASDGFGETQQQQAQQQQQQQQEHQQQEQPHQPPKKQVRRRLHTSRPYQERLLNMAEARREIVTALKFHRASMKQASQTPPTLEPEKIKSRRNPRIYPSNNTTFSDYLNNYSIGSCYSTPLSLPSQSPNFTWVPSNPSLSSTNETINLPQQTLGLNLNFNDLGPLDSCFYSNTNKDEGNPFGFSHSSPQVQEKIATDTENMIPAESASLVSPESSGGILHPVMDDEEMAEIRSLGEQHEMEWNDTVNLVKSACWFKFLKNLEIEDDGCYENGGDRDGFQFFDEIMEIPAWLQDGMGKWESPMALESCFLQPLANDSDDFLQDGALPCMELGEFEGVDAEWLL